MQKKHANLNPVLADMVAHNQLSEAKVESLVALKKFIDRMAQTAFISEEEKEASIKKFGTLPDILTWGDYFQTEIASEHWEKSDEEFTRIVQTIVFDVIASALIFTGKPKSFLDNIREKYYIALGKKSLQGKQDEESLHLGILLEYFEQMQLDMKTLTETDFHYFEEFADLAAS
ncbi:MAG: hypothetical protein D6767_06365 [Candidatus Hydrogenedentota bacterium]|nr:MAG: hypothetical protein D6767_06365 [Candidatus Hydrogenedentota bacterium]